MRFILLHPSVLQRNVDFRQLDTVTPATASQFSLDKLRNMGHNICVESGCYDWTVNSKVRMTQWELSFPRAVHGGSNTRNAMDKPFLWPSQVTAVISTLILLLVWAVHPISRNIPFDTPQPFERVLANNDNTKRQCCRCSNEPRDVLGQTQFETR